MIARPSKETPVNGTQQIARRHHDAWTRGDRTIRIVEQLTVRDDLLVSSVFVTDPAAFATSLAP
jgi:hypothetical protein